MVENGQVQEVAGFLELLGELDVGLGGLLGRLDDPAALTQSITRIKDLTGQFKAFVNSQRLVGLLREVQQQQAPRPNAALVAGLVGQAVAEIEAAK